MNQLTLDIIKLAFLAVLWLFVIAAVGVVRTDLFDQPTSPRAQRKAARQQSRHNQPTGPVRPQRPARHGRGTPKTLLVTGGNLTGTAITLAEQQITIGRAADATLVLTDDYASTRHARLYPAEWRVDRRGPRLDERHLPRQAEGHPAHARPPRRAGPHRQDRPGAA